MDSSLQEQIGVASTGQYWDVGDYRLWRSTVPDVVLYSSRRLALAQYPGGLQLAALIVIEAKPLIVPD